MRMYLISDNVDTYTGMRLSGVDGCVLHTEKELKEKLSEIISVSDIGVLLLTEKLGANFPQVVNSFRAANRTPLLVEIPDRHGSSRGENFLSAYTDSAMGVKK